MTILHEAVVALDFERSRKIVESGALSINTLDADGNTPLISLMASVEDSHLTHAQKDMIALLVELGTDAAIKNNDGKMAINLADEKEVLYQYQNAYTDGFARLRHEDLLVPLRVNKNKLDQYVATPQTGRRPGL